MTGHNTMSQNLPDMNLPDDWWRYAAVSKDLADWFSRHLLGLLLEVEVGDKTHCRVYTGFLLDYQEYLWWVTAGHVIERVGEISSNPHMKIRRMRWLDGYEVPGAESIPVDDRDLQTFSALDRGLDVGMALIPTLDAMNIVSNNRVRIMTEQAWKNIHLARPEGYYILGYPKEWVEVVETPLSGNRMRFSLRADLACLPVRRIEHRGPHRTKEFWNDPDAFYGEILPFVDAQVYQPNDIVGVSGGPLLSIERTSDGHLLYRLFGIQRSWDRDERLIRAEPIHRFVDLISE
jgi:hypothetical protein